jgi:hypothetical protein
MVWERDTHTGATDSMVPGPIPELDMSFSSIFSSFLQVAASFVRWPVHGRGKKRGVLLHTNHASLFLGVKCRKCPRMLKTDRRCIGPSGKSRLARPKKKCRGKIRGISR